MSSEQAIAILLFLTAICSHINYKFIKLPKSIGITVVALLLSSLINILSVFYTPINDYALLLLNSLGFKETFLHGMLSFLLFAAALHINPQELSQQKFAIGIFATISVIISSVLIGYATYGMSILCGLNLSIYYCFAFGALISPTDGIITLSILRGVRLPEALEMKISGEALFNDGMAIVLFFTAMALTDGDQTSIHTSKFLLFFLREFLGGIIFGGILGYLAIKLLNDIKDYDLMIILTLVLVTGGYIVAYSVLKVSGPISIVVAGLIIGSHLKLNAKENSQMQRLGEFWVLTDEILNAILFVIIGIEFVWVDITIPISVAAAVLVLASLGARWISVYIPEFILTRHHALNQNSTTVITWCGLRGGISIALALGLPKPYGDTIVALTYFLVLFSIIVQGLTIKPLINKIYHESVS